MALYLLDHTVLEDGGLVDEAVMKTYMLNVLRVC